MEMVILQVSGKILGSRIRIISKRIFFVLIFLCGVCIVFFGSSKISKTAQRANNLEKTTATVILTGTKMKNDEKDNSKQKRCYFPIAEYFVENRSYTVELHEYSFLNEDELKHNIGSEVVVEYDPWDPADCVLPDEAGKIIKVHVLDYVCSGIVVGLGILVSFFGIKKLIKNFKRENLGEIDIS